MTAQRDRNPLVLLDTFQVILDNYVQRSLSSHTSSWHRHVGKLRILLLSFCAMAYFLTQLPATFSQNLANVTFLVIWQFGKRFWGDSGSEDLTIYYASLPEPSQRIPNVSRSFGGKRAWKAGLTCVPSHFIFISSNQSPPQKHGPRS